MRSRRWLWITAGSLMVWGILQWPTTTRQGVDSKLSTQAIPLYAKGIAFLHRDIQYQLLTRQITQGLRSDQEKSLAIFRWTEQNIRPTQAGWPVVDDHILNIIIRGHGMPDQIADVFTTLSTYAGISSFWRVMRSNTTGGTAVLVFSRLDGQWEIFDVANGLHFIQEGTPAGREYRAERIGTGEKRSMGPIQEEVLATLGPVVPPHPLRAQKQMPGPRICYEVRRLVIRGGAS